MSRLGTASDRLRLVLMALDRIDLKPTTGLSLLREYHTELPMLINQAKYLAGFAQEHLQKVDDAVQVAWAKKYNGDEFPRTPLVR